PPRPSSELCRAAAGAHQPAGAADPCARPGTDALCRGATTPGEPPAAAAETASGHCAGPGEGAPASIVLRRRNQWPGHRGTGPSLQRAGQYAAAAGPGHRRARIPGATAECRSDPGSAAGRTAGTGFLAPARWQPAGAAAAALGLAGDSGRSAGGTLRSRPELRRRQEGPFIAALVYD